MGSWEFVQISSHSILRGMVTFHRNQYSCTEPLLGHDERNKYLSRAHDLNAKKYKIMSYNYLFFTYMSCARHISRAHDLNAKKI